MQSREEAMELAKQKPVKIDAKTFGARFRDKTDVYRFMTVEVGAFLPEKQQ